MNEQNTISRSDFLLSIKPIIYILLAVPFCWISYLAALTLWEGKIIILSVILIILAISCFITIAHEFSIYAKNKIDGFSPQQKAKFQFISKVFNIILFVFCLFTLYYIYLTDSWFDLIFQIVFANIFYFRDKVLYRQGKIKVD